MSTKLTGLSIATIGEPIETYHQLGGPGCVFNKALAIPAHLGAPWHSIEYVCLPPGDNGVGAHRQTTDEIYVILSGQGTLMTNGQPALVETGMLACAPAGTVHALTNRSTSEALTLLVVELEAPDDLPLTAPRIPVLCSLFQALHETENVPPYVYDRNGLVSILRATIGLGEIFSPTWGTLSLLVLPPGCRIDPFVESTADQLWYLMRGHATWTIPTDEGSGEPLLLDSDDLDQPVRSVLVPAGVTSGVTNKASGNYPLLMLRLTVRRSEQHTERETCSMLHEEEAISCI